MRDYSNKISLTRNSRGIYSLDTSIGCSSGMSNELNGCYGDCYAAKSAKIYGYNFNKTILRFFIDEKHRQSIFNRINNVKLDFIRIGCSGDPSENWEHTISIIKQIDKCNKQIVIITKHWTNLTLEQLNYFATINICINTSVSAMDNPKLLSNSIEQYNVLKKYCKSILRIVSCDFNLNNEVGIKLNKIQHDLFKNDSTLDTVFRPSKDNYFVVNDIINTSFGKFMSNEKTLISKMKKSTYTGSCNTCHEMCGLNIKPKNIEYPNKKGIIKQLKLFKSIT
jgi:hypothetical protein